MPTSRLQLSALALAALLACALARPDLTYPTNSSDSSVKKEFHVEPETTEPPTAECYRVEITITVPPPVLQYPIAITDKQNLKEVQSLDDQGKDNTIAFNDSNNTRSVHNDSVDPANAKGEGDAQQGVPLHRDESRPINQRYPHAVLFGGTCGGSIISPKWILTAGHCTMFMSVPTYVLAGTDNSEDGSGVARLVKKIYVHPLFSDGPYGLSADNNDIKQVPARWDFLLAELEEPLPLDGITMAAIPLNEDINVAPETYVGYAGYGTDHHGGTMRSDMYGMDLKTKPDETCQNITQYNREDMLCAQGYEPKNKSDCSDDSGSGLVGNGKLIGIASYHENDASDCKAGSIGVFSKVAAVRDWIRQVAEV